MYFLFTSLVVWHLILYHTAHLSKCRMSLSHNHTPSYILLLLLTIISHGQGRSLCDPNSRQLRIQQPPQEERLSRQDQVVGILTPGSSAAVGAPVEPYLPDLGFWADLGGLILGQNPVASPFVRLSRDVFESQECAEYVSCQVSLISKRHSPFKFIHSFLDDFPFDGDLAKRLKMGSSMAREGEERCGSGFKCNPLDYLNKGVKTLGLLHDVMKAVK